MSLHNCKTKFYCTTKHSVYNHVLLGAKESVCEDLTHLQTLHNSRLKGTHGWQKVNDDNLVKEVMVSGLRPFWVMSKGVVGPRIHPYNVDAYGSSKLLLAC